VCTPTAITRQVRAEDVTVVTHGHLDLGAQLVDGALVARVKDDAHVWQDPAALVLHVSDDARTTVPAGYGFLGAPGSTVWTIAEAQQPTVPWLGWNTQHPTVTAGTSGPVTFALTAVDGPGDLVVTMNGTLGGAPRRVFDTVGGPRSTAVPLSAHQHASWSFTRPGVYHVTLTQTTTTTAGRQVSAAAVLHLLVGPGDPRTAAASSTVTEWVGRTATGEACALTADQVPAGTGARTVDHRIPRAAAQVTAAAAVLAPVTSIVPAPSERVADAPAAPVPTVDPAGTGAGGAPAVLGGLAGLALVGAAATGRAWWRDQTQEDPR
jgi:putative ABC transporter-associated repeat protein